ncbi:uncharacterized protein LOC133296362 [Gastrolobium bilobum]|uniref:uncharacterized protein LOC133296362 n=1 Tax=Gastrolobium bilobum TaxID=150636 RepID=UPI002AB0EBE5|nr:uncharacterized protein LOC133296362 [Gastrolobium bilobum]
MTTRANVVHNQGPEVRNGDIGQPGRLEENPQSSDWRRSSQNPNPNDVSGVYRRKYHRGQYNDSPFVDEIVDAPFPKNLNLSEIPKYGGAQDPQVHLDAFDTAMYIKGIQEPLITRLFATTLKGVAKSWFSSLPAGSIRSFEELGGRFLLNFATSKKQPKSEFVLGKIKQQPGETLQKYLDRFKMAALQVPGLSENVHLHLVIAGLHGSFRLARSVYKNPVPILVEFTARSKKYLDLEQIEIENADPRQHHGQVEKLENRRQSDFWGKRPEEKVSTK